MRVLALVLLLAGCVAPSEAPPTTTTPDASLDVGDGLVVASPAFEDNGSIPVKHTCDGEGVSPPLAFADAPEGTVAFVLLVIDSDVPTPQTPLRDVVHWLAWNVPAENGRAAFPEGAVPNGTRQGQNVGGENAWTGPCPPLGSPAHRYVFTAHALSSMLDLDDGATREQLEAALDGRVLATGRLVGLYARQLPP